MSSGGKPILGSPNGHDTIDGTAGDDFIVAFGPGSTIVTNGGADFVNAGNGGALVLVGGAALPPVPAGTTVVNLRGSGNAVQSFAGRGQVSIPPAVPVDPDQAVFTGDVAVVGYAGGNDVVLGEGNADIDLGGAGNMVAIGGGTSLVRLTGGGNTVSVGDDAAGSLPVNAAILLSGFANTVSNGSFDFDGRFGPSDRAGSLSISGGAGNGTFSTGGADTTLRTTGTGNVVNVGRSGTSTIVPGDGHDRVDVGAFTTPFAGAHASVTIVLKGQYDSVGAIAASLAISGGDGHNIYALTGKTFADGSNDPFDYGQNDPVDGFTSFESRTYTVVAGGLGNTFTLDDTNKNTIVAGYGYDSITLRHPVFRNEGDPPPDAATVPTRLADLTVFGNHNTVVAGDGPTTLDAPGSDNTVTLGNGDNTVTFNGARDTVSVGTGHNQIDGGFLDTMVHLNGGTDSVLLSGLRDAVFLGGSEHATISGSDQRYATLDVLAGTVHATLNEYGYAPGGSTTTVILEAGTVAATTKAELAAALHSDSAGGLALTLLGGGVLDFHSAAGLSVANFVLR